MKQVGPKKILRRQFLRLAASVVTLPAASIAARAQTYPARPVRLIVGDAVGGAPDIVARLIGQWLSKRLGQPFIVDNKPGAGSTIAMATVAKAPPDGYTLGLVGTSSATSMSLYEKLTYDLNQDIVPIAGVARGPLVMVVHPSFPATTVGEFIAYAKTNPDKVNMASAGNGSGPHVAGALFDMISGCKMIHVPFRGGPPALTAVLGGQVQVYFVAMSSSISLIKSGKLRALAVTTAKRVEALPHVPSVDEVLPGYEASIWFGVGAPKNTPADIIDKLHDEIAGGIADPELKARLAELGSTSLAGSASDFGKLVLEETEKWAKVVKFSGAKAE